MIINISTNPFDYLFFSIGNFIKVCIYKSWLFDFDMHQTFETVRIKSQKHFDFNAFLIETRYSCVPGEKGNARVGDL